MNVLDDLHAAIRRQDLQRHQRRERMRGLALGLGSAAEVIACFCAHSLGGWAAVGVVTMAIFALECGFYRRLTEER
jgi:hypothetical protein